MCTSKQKLTVAVAGPQLKSSDGLWQTGRQFRMNGYRSQITNVPKVTIGVYGRSATEVKETGEHLEVETAQR